MKIVRRYSQARQFHCVLVKELIRRAEVTIDTDDPRHVMVAVARFAFEATYDEIGCALGVSKTRAQHLALRGLHALRQAHRGGSREGVTWRESNDPD